ncbi:C-type lectin domain family 1 member A-like [Lepisosteus oculatus]|uniref:C-type lectin domain family 1 member A-like n=1 Tax=Lepisosteus oculatus TaxID=7918 RepID=UPI0035F5137D
MDPDSVYTGLQKPAQDVYETVTRRAEREPGGEQTTVQCWCRRGIPMALGVTVCVLLVTVIALGTVLWKTSRDCEIHLREKNRQLERLRNETERNRTETQRYIEDLESVFCVDPSTGERKQQCCPQGWKEGDCGRCYYVSTERRSWESAHQFCSSVEAHLVEIENKRELRVLNGLVQTYDYWTGLSRKDRGGAWSWVTGGALNTALVAVSESHRGGDRAAAFRGSGEVYLYSASCTLPYQWICEAEPEIVWAMGEARGGLGKGVSPAHRGRY